jgi:plastocyanin
LTGGQTRHRLAATLNAATMAARKDDMSRPSQAGVAIAAMTALVVAALAVPVFAAAPPSNVTQKTVGGPKFVPNRSFTDAVHFKLDRINIKKGGTLTLRETTKVDHTFSLVKKSQVPRSFRAVDACFGKGPCDDLAVAHGAINPETGEDQEPTKLLVNVGAAGFNRPGDSIVVPARKTVKVKITSAGPMYFICAIHPWMLGSINAPAPR